MTEQERRAALERALTGQLDDWRGLPAGCTAADFAALAGGEGAKREGRLAAAPVALVDYGGFAGPLRVFFDDAGHAFLVWADWPPGDGAESLAPLGPPEAVLSDQPSRRPGTVQQVWGTRGLAAYVAADGAARGLALFGPASVETYLAILGGDEEPPYRPRGMMANDVARALP